MTRLRMLGVLAAALLAGCADPPPQHTATVTSYPPADALTFLQRTADLFQRAGR